MIIPINIAISRNGVPLPPQLARFGTDEVVLIELQGALEVEGETADHLVGKLDLESDPVSQGHLHSERVFDKTPIQ